MKTLEKVPANRIAARGLALTLLEIALKPARKGHAEQMAEIARQLRESLGEDSVMLPAVRIRALKP